MRLGGEGPLVPAKGLSNYQIILYYNFFWDNKLAGAVILQLIPQETILWLSEVTT